MKKEVMEFIRSKQESVNSLNMGNASDIAKNKKEDAYKKLNNGDRIHLYQVQLLDTPKAPDTALIARTSQSGEILGYNVDIGEYLRFLQQSLDATADLANSKAEDRIYRGSSFYRDHELLLNALTKHPGYQEENRVVYGTFIKVNGNRVPFTLAKEDPLYIPYVTTLAIMKVKAIDPVVKPVINVLSDEAEYNNDAMDAFRVN